MQPGGNDREAIFFHEEDDERYREWLGVAASQYGLAIHAYVLMTNIDGRTIIRMRMELNL